MAGVSDMGMVLVNGELVDERLLPQGPQSTQLGDPWSQVMGPQPQPQQQQQQPQPQLLDPLNQPRGRLIAPEAEYTPQYTEEDMYKPRRMLWAGLMQDLAGQFSGWNGSSMGAPSGAAHTFHERALSQNRAMREANRQGQREHRADNNAYANMAQQFIGNEVQLDAAKQARELGIDIGAGQDHINWILAGSPGEFEEWMEDKSLMAARDGRTANQKDFQTYQDLQKSNPAAAKVFREAFVEKQKPFTQSGLQFSPDGLSVFYNGQWHTANAESVRAAADSVGETTGRVKGAEATELDWQAQTQLLKTNAQQIPVLTERATDLEEMAQALETGTWGQATGPLEGRLSVFNNPDTAEMKMMSVQNLLETIKGAGMGPISETEFTSLLGIFADPHSSPAVNARKLRRIASKLRKDANGLQSKYDYINQRGSLEGYGQPQQQQQQAAPQQAQAPMPMPGGQPAPWDLNPNAEIFAPRQQRSNVKWD